MKSTIKTMVAFSALMLIGSSSSYASSTEQGEKKAFDCVDKKSFEISSECMSSKIENNLAFKKAEKEVFKGAIESNDRALATMTFDEQTMTIKVVGHRDSSIAKADTKKD